MSDQWMYRYGEGATFGPFGSREEAARAARGDEMPLRVYSVRPPDIGDYLPDAGDVIEILKDRLEQEIEDGYTRVGASDDLTEANADLRRVLTEWAGRHVSLDVGHIADGEGERVDSAHLLLEDRLWWLTLSGVCTVPGCHPEHWLPSLRGHAREVHAATRLVVALCGLMRALSGRPDCDIVYSFHALRGAQADLEALP